MLSINKYMDSKSKQFILRKKTKKPQILRSATSISITGNRRSFSPSQTYYVKRITYYVISFLYRTRFGSTFPKRFFLFSSYSE